MSNEDREALAREGGWIPEDEWDHTKTPPKSGFKSADEFLDDGIQIQKSMAKKLESMEAKLTKSNEALEQQQTDFRKMSDLVHQSHEAELDALKRDLERKRSAAIDEGDSEAAIAADREINELNNRSTSAAGIDPAAQAAVDRWVSANQWYADNPDLRKEADQIGVLLDREGVIPPGPARLAAVEAEIRRRFPDELSSERVVGGAPGSPEGSARTTRKTSGRTYEDLPTEAKSAYDRMKKLNPKLTKSMYTSQYEWE